MQDHLQQPFNGGVQPAAAAAAAAAVGLETAAVQAVSSSNRLSISQCYLCGCLSAGANVAVSFPLNKIVFRQQLESVRFTIAARQVLRTEFWTLYRGALPPLLQRSCNLSAMFGCYAAFSTGLSRQFPRANAELTRAASACMAGACEAAFMPFERVQTLLQLRAPACQHAALGCHARGGGGCYRGTFHAFVELRAVHGLSEWYRGLSAVFLRNSFSTGLYFVLKERAQRCLGRANSFQESFALGSVLGALLSTIVYPLNVAKTHMQATVGGEFVSPRAALLRVYGNDGAAWGLRRIFRGVPANCCRATLSWGVVTASYDFFARRLFGVGG